MNIQHCTFYEVRSHEFEWQALALNAFDAFDFFALHSQIKHGPGILYDMEAYPSLTDLTAIVLSVDDTLSRTATVYDPFVEV